MPARIVQRVALCGNFILMRDMQEHGIRTEGVRKEIRCSDCGHLYLIAEGQQSSRCLVCGNIEFFAANVEPMRDLGFLSKSVLEKRVLPRIQVPDARTEKPKPFHYSLEDFKKTPDGKVVEEILIRYQVEWQLWSMVVRNFQEPAFHSAYLAYAAAYRAFDQASARYRDHRSAMLLLQDSAWQSEVADLMLHRLEAMANVRMELEGRNGIELPHFVHLLPSQSRILKYAWFFFGMALLSKLFGII